MSREFRKPGGKIAAVSDLDSLIYRGLDTSYFSKWTGLWVPPFKYMDYHAYRVNGEWLSPDKVQNTHYGEGLRHRFKLQGLEVTEELSAGSDFTGMTSRLKIRNSSKGPTATRIGLEAGIDIREKSCDIGPEQYQIEKDDSITVSAGQRSLTIDPNRSFESPGAPRTKEHEPGGERQRCIIPGEIGFNEEIDSGESFTVQVDFRTDQKSSDLSLQENRSAVKGYLQEGFRAAQSSLKNLSYDRNGTGIIAGHPWFQSYWARDCFWTILGAIDAGYLDIAERTVENFARRDIPGRIFLDGQDSDSFSREDTYPLFVIAAKKLSRHRKLSDTVKKSVEDAMNNLELDERGVVKHDSEGTWMDTLERSPAIDIQALWLEAARETDDTRKKKLKNGMELFAEEKYLADFIGDNVPRTVNASVPLMFGQIDQKFAERCLRTLNAEFSSLYGARTRSVTDPGYNSSGYHEGSVWGLTTGWAAAANLEYGNSRAGMNFLERLARSGDFDQPGGFPEVMDAESGTNLGCTEQAWSAGMLTYVMDSFLLGMEVEDRELSVNPNANITCKRKKRVGDRYLTVEFKNGEAEITDEETAC